MSFQTDRAKVPILVSELRHGPEPSFGATTASITTCPDASLIFARRLVHAPHPSIPICYQGKEAPSLSDCVEIRVRETFKSAGSAAASSQLKLHQRLRLLQDFKIHFSRRRPRPAKKTTRRRGGDGCGIAEAPARRRAGVFCKKKRLPCARCRSPVERRPSRLVPASAAASCDA